MKLKCLPVALLCLLLTVSVACNEEEQPDHVGTWRWVAYGQPVIGSPPPIPSGTFLLELRSDQTFTFTKDGSVISSGNYTLQWKGRNQIISFTPTPRYLEVRMVLTFEEDQLYLKSDLITEATPMIFDRA